MALEPNNPHGICVGMDISVGAMKSEPKKTKRYTKSGDGSSLGEMEFFHGILPQWKFIDEKYFEEWEKKQVKYKERLGELSKRRHRNRDDDYLKAHNDLLCLVGPEWYQELSPKQKEIIDNLRITIKKDLDSHFTKATQSSLSHLGMRPLPNDSQLWKAMRESFGCPIEFLLLSLLRSKADMQIQRQTFYDDLMKCLGNRCK